MFFCFPDPHFKRKNHGRRIVSERLLSEYAWLLKPTIGRLYCITDVLELHEWHVDKCDKHPLFRRLTEEEVKEDPCVEAMQTATEESQKVDRAGSCKYYAVYQRIPNEDAPKVTAENFF
jgi:tRNA (guanine-N7-)-methyltransferase